RVLDDRLQVPVSLLRRGRRIDPQRVLGQVPPERGGQPERLRLCPQQGQQRGDAMAAVVVARATTDRQPAGDRQRPPWVVGRQSELTGGDLHRGREARVQVDVPELGRRDARVLQRGLAQRVDGRRGGEPGAVGDVPLVVAG